ncbi:MAG: ABC transporter permease [Anaerolineales bacterium]|nr:ABC transporter permease [Anaerolineales bacterium]
MAETGMATESFWRSFVRKRAGVLGLIMLTVTILVAVFAPWIAPYDPYEPVDATAADVMAPPSPEHPLGQDEVGKDVLSLLIYGARISLFVGFAASLIIVLLGVTIGMTAGYAGGRVDTILMRITDAILVIPALALMLVIIAVAGRGIGNIILVIGLLSWTYMARVVRAQVLSVKERQFILRARAIGVGTLGIITVHVLPQLMPVIFASATLDVSFAILSEASLSFLGLGDPTLISWGSMLNRAFMRGAVTRGAWWYLIPPGFALAWVTLGLALLSNAVQEIVNPRLSTHHLFDERKMVSFLRRLSRKESPPEELSG